MMAPSSWLLLVTVLLLAVPTAPKDGYKSAPRLRKQSRRIRRTYTTYNTYNTYPSGTHGKGLTWWQITLIIGGILFAFLLLYVCVRMCRNSEPQSDTPGIDAARDRIQLRDHHTINHFPPPAVAASYGPPGPAAATNGHPVAAYRPVAAVPPPSYDDALVIPTKSGTGDDFPDQWQDQPVIDRKDFGVL